MSAGLPAAVAALQADKVKCRREKRKVAQRAFRQRQIDTIRMLREENAVLKAALAAAGISTESGCRTDISDASNSHLHTQCHDRQLAYQIEDLSRVSDSHNSTPRLTPASSDQSNFPNTLIRSLPGQLHNRPEDTHEGFFYDTTQLQSWSPCPKASIDFPQPPPDIIPFLGLSAYGVAGQLFWATLAFAYTTLKAMNTLEPPLQARLVAKSVFGTTLTQMSFDDMAALLADRLAFRSNSHGFVQVVSSITRARRERILEAARQIHKSDPGLLDSFAVEKELMGVLGSRFEDFRRTLCGDRRGPEEETRLMKELVRMMTARASCTGDGPRWDRETVLWIASKWIAHCSAIVDIS